MKALKLILVFVLLFSALFVLGACGEDNNSDNTPIDPDKVFNIQYINNEGLQTIKVKHNTAFSIDNLPSKQGYDFLGYFDSEEGGTQYVDALGGSLSSFTDYKDMVLYPRFKAEEYIVSLDYQGASGSINEIKVSYDSIISSLPMDATMTNKTFVGWFTEPNGKGTQIADKYGVITKNAKVTANKFDLTDEDGYIYLFAYFKAQEHTVSLYIGNNPIPEEIKVEHGTHISEIQTKSRVNGKAVLTWSKQRNDTTQSSIFNGKIENDMILYSCELAPIIELDSNGGSEVSAIIAKAGDTISLPTPKRDSYKFIGWVDSTNKVFDSTTMPQENLKLKAKWQAMIIFDENGGEEIEDISEARDTIITLPIPQKEGYIFAGWYDVNKAKYETSKMPSESINLKAGWYKEVSKTVNVSYKYRREWYDDGRIDWSYPSLGYWYEDYPKSFCCGHLKIFFNDTFADNKYRTVRIDWNFVIHTADPNASNSVYVDFYSEKKESTLYLLDTEVFSDLTKDTKTYKYTTDFYICDDFYVSFYDPTDSDKVYVTQVYYTMYYADETTLYL
ncbi:MAG: InlB B-repeat-containing protein [Clostridia bacterium]|nr:InlB B-repeat-containing protein [Clostridia bacterium]